MLELTEGSCLRVPLSFPQGLFCTVWSQRWQEGPGAPLSQGCSKVTSSYWGLPAHPPRIGGWAEGAPVHPSGSPGAAPTILPVPELEPGGRCFLACLRVGAVVTHIRGMRQALGPTRT